MTKISGPMKSAMQRNISKLYRVFMPAVILCVLLAAGMQSSSAVRPIEPVLPQNQAVKKALPTYTCPMHPEVKSTKRGKCPKCGMALRLDAAPSAASSVPNANNELAASVTTEKKPNHADNGSGAARKMDIPDVEVLDQDGRVIHFYSDLVKGKTVAINFIFTNCTTICPPLAATFARVQKELGDKVGRDVFFISVSVDPVTDTPERLKAWGAKFKAGAGWTFVTGDKQEIDKLLNALGASVGRKEDHSPAVLVGNDAKGVWTRTYGLAKTSQMVGLILNMMEGKTDEATAKENDKP